MGPVLRIVPSFVTAHTFCVSPDGPSNSSFLRMVPTKTNLRYFCAAYDYAGKGDFSKGYWNTKRKLGLTTHCSEITGLQCGQIFYILKLFRIIQKNARLTPISFLDSNSPC